MQKKSGEKAKKAFLKEKICCRMKWIFWKKEGNLSWKMVPKDDEPADVRGHAAERIVRRDARAGWGACAGSHALLGRVYPPQCAHCFVQQGCRRGADVLLRSAAGWVRPVADDRAERNRGRRGYAGSKVKKAQSKRQALENEQALVFLYIWGREAVGERD